MNYFSSIYLIVFVSSFIITSFLVISRLRKAIKGTKVSTKKSIIFSIYLIIISAYLINSSLFSGVSVIYLIPYMITVFFSTYYSFNFSKKNLVFVIDPTDNRLLVKGGLLLYISYIICLFLRISINFIFFGYQEIDFDKYGNMYLTNKPFVVTDYYVQANLLIITDFLLMVGTGLLLGRNLRIIKYYSKINK